MLRKFIQCRSNEQRLEFVKESNVKDWTSSQLETALEIVGFNKNISNFSDEEKKVTLANVIADNMKAEGSDDQIFTDNMKDDKMVEDETVYGTKTDEEKFRQTVAYAFVSQATMRL